MSPRHFSHLLAAVYAQPFSNSRLQVVLVAAQHNYFTSAQARRLVGAMTFSNDRVNAAVALYPQVIDQGNFFEVMGAFRFQSARTQVSVRLGF